MAGNDSEFSVTTDRNGSRSFGDHDDRWSSDGPGGRGGRGGGKYRGRGNYRGGPSNRSKSYYGGGGYNSYNKRGKGGGSIYSSRGKGRGQGSVDPRSRLDEDGDLIMEGDESQPTSHKRFTPYGGRPYRSRGRGGNRYDNSSHSSNQGPSSSALSRLGLPMNADSRDTSLQWFKITIPWGKKAGKEYILKMVNSHSELPFIPTYFHFEDNKAVFYVQDKQSADSIRRISGRITMPNGYKMTLLVKPSSPPVMPLDDKEKDKLKVVMSGRYEVSTKTLSLSNMYQDKDLQEDKLYLPLSRPQVMSNVLKIIEENIPELEKLDMSNNRLMNLELFSSLVSKTPNMVEINLSQNRLIHIDELKKISGWKLTAIGLKGNGFSDKFSKDQTSYISAVRKMFPKVMKLDDIELPPPITFDIEAHTELPKTKGSFFPNNDIQTLVIQFLKDYNSVYDSADRNPLSGAYHEDALFSLSTSYNGAIQYKQPSLQAYVEESRNLMRNRGNDQGSRRRKLLRKGNHIIPQLCLLPKTKHDPNSFVVDINYSSSLLLNFTLSGVFKEGENPSDRTPLRAFSRTLVTVPRGQSMVITNDMLTITNASPEQIQAAFKHPAPTPSSSPVPEQVVVSPFEAAGPSLSEVQKQMVTSFMNDSRMNLEYSMKFAQFIHDFMFRPTLRTFECLQENNWEYEKAGKVFMELQSKNQIPLNAFK